MQCSCRREEQPRHPVGPGHGVCPWAGDDPLHWSLHRRIEQYVIRNPGDWSAEDLFDALGAIDKASDTRFTLFLEGLASSGVVPDEPTQRRVAVTVNRHLRPAGAELRETGDDGGYPVFSVVSTRVGRARQPKNVIFASRAKPDIRFRDAIDNDIEIVGDADDVLIYDRRRRRRPVGRPAGLVEGPGRDRHQPQPGQLGAVTEALQHPARELAPAAEPVLPLPHHLPRHPLRAARAPARGVAALGPQGSHAARSRRPAEASHGLPAAVASR